MDSDYDYNEEKNQLLKESRGISFEDIINAIEDGYLIANIPHFKKEKYKNAVVDFLRMKAQQKVDEVVAALEQIEQASAQIEQAKQEGQAVDPMLQRQLQQAKAVMTKKSFLEKEEVNKLERYYKIEYKDILEILSEKGVKYLMKKQELPAKFNQGFEEKLKRRRQKDYKRRVSNTKTSSFIFRRREKL